jgi:hypothetical protein
MFSQIRRSAGAVRYGRNRHESRPRPSSARLRSSSPLPRRHKTLWLTRGELNRPTTEKNKDSSRLPISSATAWRSWLRIPLS